MRTINQIQEQERCSYVAAIDIQQAERKSELPSSTGSARTYFFGVIDAKHPGHFLYEKGGSGVWQQEKILPFNYIILDGRLLHSPQDQGRLHLAVINGWTVMGMWDRTGDNRGNSNASFIAEGVHTLEQMKRIASRDFPSLWARVQNA